jgi:hypothetical protein
MKLDVAKLWLLLLLGKQMFFITLINYVTLFYNRTATIKDLAVQLISKLHCHAHVDYILPQSVGMLGLKRTETFPFLLLTVY